MNESYEQICVHLNGLTASGKFLNAGVACVDVAGETSYVCGRMEPDGIALVDPTLRLRMASITKAATARAVVNCASRMKVSLGCPMSDFLAFAPEGITLAQLLSHTSGLTDHAGYIVDPPAPMSDLLAFPGAVSGDIGYFRYANLNYILLGLILERMTGRRFDRVLQEEVLGPAGTAGGFNWVGVTDRRALPVWQRRGDTMSQTADGPGTDWAADLVWRDGAGVTLANYRIGQDTTWFSPHAGLRMNVLEAARLARFLASDDATARKQRQVQWAFNGRNGEDCDGLFTHFGAGLTLYGGHDRIPGRLVGHAGHALGFTGGAWSNLETGIAWAYFLNGSADLTEGQDEEAFYDPDELAIMARL